MRKVQQIIPLRRNLGKCCSYAMFSDSGACPMLEPAILLVQTERFESFLPSRRAEQDKSFRPPSMLQGTTVLFILISGEVENPMRLCRSAVLWPSLLKKDGP